MKIFSKRLSEFEQACADPYRVGWFGSVAIGDGEEQVLATGLWLSRELNPDVPATISGREIKPPPWFGSYELTPPGH